MAHAVIIQPKAGEVTGRTRPSELASLLTAYAECAQLYASAISDLSRAVDRRSRHGRQQAMERVECARRRCEQVRLVVQVYLSEQEVA